MGGGSSFLAILRITAFLSAIWGVGKGAKLMGMSTIAFEIVVGLILSPSLVGLMPAPYAECQHKDDLQCDLRHVEEAVQEGHSSKLYHLLEHHDLCHEERNAWVVYSEEAHSELTTEGHSHDTGGEVSEHSHAVLSGGLEDPESHHSVHGLNIEPCFQEMVLDSVAQMCSTFNNLVECAETECEAEIDHACTEEPNVFTMVGHAGVSLMVFESGMHFDFEKGARVGFGACLVAVVGTILPIVAGMFMTWFFGDPIFPDGLAVGVALTPTSPVVALKLLMEAKQLQKDFGQAVITAAFVDDVLSLVAFNVLFATTSGEFSLMTVVIKPIIGVVFMLVGGFMGLKFWPKVVPNLLAKVPPKAIPGGMSRHDEVLLVLVFVLLIGYAAFTWALGTHLWGCFVAGMSFACIHHVHHLWEAQLKRITMWMLRIFFSCTVAFAIPFDELLSFEAFWQGALMSLVTCVFTKVFCALFMGEARWVIGWAMVGRAEFAFLIAEMAKSAGIVTPKMFAVMIWALLWATIVTPFCFKKVLQRYLQKTQAKEDADGAIAGSSGRRGSGGLRLSGGTDDSSKGLPGFPLWQGRNNSAQQGGFRWVPCSLTSLHFQIVYPKTSTDCSGEETKVIFNLMHQNGLIVTSTEQKCDQEHHLATFQVQPRDGKPLEESQLDFLQQELFTKLQCTGAYIIFSPPSPAMQNPCKFAAVRVFANLSDFPLASDGNGAVTAICNIVKQMVNHDLRIMRAGLEMHGTTCIVKLLICRPGEELNEESVWRSLSQKFFRASGMSGSDPDATDARDITPAELEEVKKAIEESLNRHVIAMVEPLSYGYDPVGMLSHDAETLSAGQLLPLDVESMSTFDVCVYADLVSGDFFSPLLDVIRSHALGLLSAQVDESANCKAKLIILCKEKSLADGYLEGLLTDLSNSCAKHIRSARIELSGSDIPKKKVRCIGESKLQAEVAAGPCNTSLSAWWPSLQSKSSDTPQPEKPVICEPVTCEPVKSEPDLDSTDKKVGDQDSAPISMTDSTASTTAEAPVVRGRVVHCFAPVLPCQPRERGLLKTSSSPPSTTTCLSKLPSSSSWRPKQVNEEAS